MAFKKYHFKIFPEALSHTKSLVYSIKFHLYLYKHSKTLIISKTSRKEVKRAIFLRDSFVCLMLEKFKFLTLLESWCLHLVPE